MPRENEWIAFDNEFSACRFAEIVLTNLAKPNVMRQKLFVLKKASFIRIHFVVVP